MKAARIAGFTVCLLLLATAAQAGITTITQKLDYTNNYNEWASDEDPNRIVFIPPGGTIDNTQEEWPILDHLPWYRMSTQRWGWTHSIVDRIPPDVDGIESATLTIEAWDVNYNYSPPEVDQIIINNKLLGNLDDTSVYEWGTTTFDLDENQDILTDLWMDGELYVYFKIDSMNRGHRVTLGSSTLTVNYYVTGPGRGVTQPVFRFWSPTLSRHFYTTVESERDGVIHNYPSDWHYEGIGYYLPTDDSDPNLKPVYRFWSPLLRSHFYTLREDERDYVLEHYSNTWDLEGVAFYAYPAGQQPADSSPIYRFWSASLNSHFYTISEDERDGVIANYSAVWLYEGVAWYAYE
jgi:hypothetical protein